MEVLPFGDDRISPVKAVPGIYISGLRAASSPSNLVSNGITHIITALTDYEIIKQIDPGGARKNYTVKQIKIDDDGDKDILIHLGDVCEWIDNALDILDTTNHDPVNEWKPKNHVLIHCRQGVSRSGAFLIGYLMKHLSQTYSHALAMARESRHIVTPNPGFEQQLRIWEYCKYDIYIPNPPLSPAPVSTPGPDKIQWSFNVAQIRNFKKAYTVWKKERDIRVDADLGPSKTQYTGMANLAAEFGKRRLALRRKDGDGTGGREEVGGPQDSVEEKNSERSSYQNRPKESDLRKKERQRQWQRVEQMEKTWNERLIRGEVQRSSERNDLETSLSEAFESIRNSA